MQLTPKAFDTLLLLVENGGRLVTKEQLMEAIWPHAFVEEKTLAQNIFTLRKVLGPDADGRHYIETVPKHGYRFRGEAEAVRHDHYASSMEQDIRRGDGAQLDLIARPAKENIGAAPSPRAVRRKTITLAVIAVVAAFASLAVGGFIYRGGGLEKSAFQKIDMSRLTNGGSITSLGLSPDGKYVAYGEARGDTQSLFVRQVETTSSVEIVPPSPVGYRGITFSGNGAWVYYVAVERGSLSGTLYRVPLLGGASQKVVQGSVDSRAELSPDGKRIAFVRWTDRATTALVIANADGTDERQLAARNYGDGFSLAGPAWSPDGKTLLAPTQSYNGQQPYASIVELSIEGGTTRTLLAGRWTWIGQLTWLADGSGIVLTAWDSDSEVMSDQVWIMSYPKGETRRVTSDVNGYLGLGASADARIIAASQSTPAVNFWVAPGGDWTQARKITNGAGDIYSQRLGLAWTPDGRIIYSTRQSGNPDVWVMEPDGTRQKQLTFEPGADLQPVPSPDGRYIVFVSTSDGKTRLKRMDSDGGNSVLLADGDGIRFPSISPDGKWVVYAARARERLSTWRVPIEGGEPVQLTGPGALQPSVSPDGKSIAGLVPDDALGQAKLTLVAFDDGRVIKRFEGLVPLSFSSVRWSPDGRSLTYVVTREGVSNIWSQPVEGGMPKALTDWKADLIYRFDWSKDGRLLCERGTTKSDVILIRDAGEH
ncbi:MAG TPA: winged helix-turn-helix domain-containing protein [Blastocatellia bacterium]|nr:winged helix-turn-helix domain-containing protein [Blastocatellia bacterium]